MHKSKTTLATVLLLSALLSACSKKTEAPAVSNSSAAATPDLSGPWQISAGQAALKPADGTEVPLLADARKVYEANKAAKAKGENGNDPAARCVPPGVPRLTMQNFPWDIVQGKRHVTFLFEWNHLNRMVYMNEPNRFEPIGPTWLGQSIGKWEGDTLVVDTIYFNGKSWLDDMGLPSSDELHTVERYHLIDGGNKLELKVTITDPKTYSAPWDAVVTFDKKPGVILKEDYCFKRVGLVK
jgi:hypothetical protein